MEIKILDNFLHEKTFQDLRHNLCGNLTPMHVSDSVSGATDPLRGTPGYFQLTNWVYEGFGDNQQQSEMWKQQPEALIELLRTLKVFCLRRIKVNWLPHTKEIIEHPLHVDFGKPKRHIKWENREFFPPVGLMVCCYYLNTCDGYTHFEDGSKVDCVANRAAIFPGKYLHGSSTTTNANWRQAINIVYFEEII